MAFAFSFVCDIKMGVFLGQKGKRVEIDIAGKKRFEFAALVALLLSLVFLAPKADASEFGDFRYRIESDGSVVITDYMETGSDAVIVPDSIDGRPVTVIGEEAFYDSY